MPQAVVSIDFEARKNAYLFREWLSDHSDEELQGFFIETSVTFLFLTDKRLGMWDSNWLKEKRVVDLKDIGTITRHEKLTGPKVVITKKDGSDVTLSSTWLGDSADIDLLLQMYAGFDAIESDSHRDHLFDITSEQIPVPSSLQSPNTKAAQKQAVAWEKKRAKWVAEGRQKEQARFAKEKERRFPNSSPKDDSQNLDLEAQTTVSDSASDIAEEAERKNEEVSVTKTEQAETKHVAKVRRGLLPGEECGAALGKTLSTVFVSNMRIGVVKSEAQIVEDVRLQDIESLRLVEGKFGWKLMLKTKGSDEVKLWSGDGDEAKRFLSTFERESASPHPLYSELLAQYDAAMEIAPVSTQKKAAPVRNWLLKALVSHSNGESTDVIRALEKVFAKVDSFDDFKAVVSRFVKAGQLDSSYLPVELVTGDKRWMSSGGYALVFPKVLVINGSHCALSESTRAEVVEEGQDNTQYVYEGQYFTGGAALLLGTGASSRKVGKDSRRAFLVLTDAKWQQAIELHPDKVAEAKKFISRLPKLIATLQPSASQRPTPRLASAEPATSGVADELRKLKALCDEGAISSEEYEAAKRKVLGI